MFAEKIGESCATTGTVPFLLGGAYGAFRTWRSGFASGEPAFYLATNPAGTVWELGYGTFTVGAPDSLTRTLLASSSGALINWTTVPYRVYSVPTGTSMKHMLAPLAAARPAWLPAGATWIDTALGLAVAWVKKRWNGTADMEEGRYHVAEAIYAASQRTLFADKGAAGYTMTAADVGKTLLFDTTAGVRILTLPAHDAAGIGHGAYVYVQPYGSSSNGVTITPNGAETADLATAPPGRRTLLMWDGARSVWRSDYKAPAAAMTVYPKGTISGLTYSNGTDAVNDIDVAAGGCMDATGAYYMSLSALTKQLDAAWAVGNNAGGLDTGSAANADYYIYAIARPDTGVTDVLFSLHHSAPTMPADYTYKRLIGWFKRAGGTIVALSTWETAGGGLAFRWPAPTLDVSESGTLTTSRRLDAVKVPLNFSVDALVVASADDAAATFLARVCSPAEADGAPSATAVPLANINRGSGATSAQAELTVRTDSSGRIAARATLATVDTYAVMTLGFNWSRR